MDLQITRLTKDYGTFRALDDVTLEIPGCMFGLLGPNGAGKSTLMRILATLLRPTSGEIRIGDVDALRAPDLLRRHLGYIPQEFGFYDSLNAYDMLDYIGAMKNLSSSERKRQIADVLEAVNLTAEARRKVGSYSGGMKQRLGIAQALLGDPELLIVDEPTAGLDPEERIRFRNLLARISAQRTVLLSTHIVADVEASCTGLAIIRAGKLAFDGTPDGLIAEANGRVWQLEVTPVEWEWLASQLPVVSSRTVGDRIHLRVIASECPLGRGVPATPTLEDGYMTVIEPEPSPVTEASLLHV